MQSTITNIDRDRIIEQDHILTHKRQLFAQSPQIQRGDVTTINQDLSARK